MSLGRLWLVLGRDVAHNSRRVLFWIWILLLFLLTWGLSAGNVRIQSGDSSVGGVKAHMTSEFAVTQVLMIFVPLIYAFFASVAAGMTLIQDDENRVGEVLHATPLRPGEYIWGKFLAVVACVLVVLALHLAFMIFFQHVVPAGESQEFRGELVLRNYLRPALVFSLPTLIFFAGVAFAMGEFTRKPILVFFLPLAVLMSCLFFLWEWSPAWLDPRIDRLLMLIDPAGFRWLNETLLKVDRGVRYYNTEAVPLDGLIVANRLIVLAIGLGAVLLTQRHFRASLRGVWRRAESKWRKGGARKATEAASLASARLADLAMTSRKPGLISGTWTVLRAELTELRSSAGLYLFVPLLVLQAVGPNLIAVGAFDTPLLITSGTFAARSLNPLTTLLCLLLLFYTVESLGREGYTRLAAISLVTPVRTGSILLGKALANAVLGLAVVLLTFLVGLGFLLYQGKVPVEPLPFALIWCLLLVPTLLLWTSFVMMTFSLTSNRYASYAIALTVLGFTAYKQIVGEMNWVGNWPLWGSVQWSDISILEFDRSALILNRVMVLGLSLLFIVLTTRLYPRRDSDAAATMQRIRPTALLKSALWLLPVALVPIVSGSILWAKVDRGFQGEATRKLVKDYWRKNLATYLDWKLPDITAVDMDVELDPARGWLKSSGTYDLANNQAGPIREIPLTGGLHWESVRWTLDGNRFDPANRSGLYVFQLPRPLLPGKKTRIGFQFQGQYPRGISKRGGGNNEFILPTGVVLTSFGTSFAPAVGYMKEVGVDKENSYESREYPDEFYEGVTESAFGARMPYTTRLKITGPADLTYNSVGTLASESVKDGRRTVTWESDQPVNFFNIVAGRWEVRRGKGTAVYYSKKHPYNVDEMVEALDAARKYYSEWFWPYPWAELKLSEFPALASYAQGFPTDITFSESIGFLTRSDPKANAAFMVAAHESAHQWWGNLIGPGKGPGGNLLSEGTSHFSTMLLFEQVKGIRGRIEFARQIEDSYGKQRSPDSERPLVKTDGTKDGDTTVTYDKTGWVLWMLMNHMGRDRMLAGIREFFQLYHANPDHPVLQDLLAVLRKHAEDPKAFDAFTYQWFFRVVVPEYNLSDWHKERDGKQWVVKGRIKNIGSGKMPIEVAATSGERFAETGSAISPSYRESRKTITLDAEQSDEVTIRCDFEPNQVVVDPDAKVLMLRRKAAVTKF